MYLDRPHDDRRPAQRDAIRRELARLVATLERDAPPRLVLGVLIDVARRMRLRLEGDDPIIRPRGRPRARP